MIVAERNQQGCFQKLKLRPILKASLLIVIVPILASFGHPFPPKGLILKESQYDETASKVVAIVLAQQTVTCSITYYGQGQATTLARSLLQQRLVDFDRKKCAMAFSGVNIKATARELTLEAAKVKFVDARPNSPDAALTQDQIVGNGIGIAVSDTVGYGITAQTIHYGRG